MLHVEREAFSGDLEVVQLVADLLGATSGTIQCADTMNRPEYWRE